MALDGSLGWLKVIDRSCMLPAADEADGFGCLLDMSLE